MPITYKSTVNSLQTLWNCRSVELLKRSPEIRKTQHQNTKLFNYSIIQQKNESFTQSETLVLIS